jgi:hypothetical protein
MTPWRRLRPRVTPMGHYVRTGEWRGNPIVWHRSKWRWRHRNTPAALCTYEYEHGSVAFRRLIERSPYGSTLDRLFP